MSLTIVITTYNRKLVLRRLLASLEGQSDPDFEVVDFGSSTPAGFFANNQNNKIEKGIVGPLGTNLGLDGKPVYFSDRAPGFYNTVTSQATFDQWFNDVAGVNATASGAVIR